LEFDNISSVVSLTIDNQDNLWCAAGDAYAFYDGQEWTIDNSSFKNSVMVIEQAPDGKMWFGTGDGVYIKE